MLINAAFTASFTQRYPSYFETHCRNFDAGVVSNPCHIPKYPAQHHGVNGFKGYICMCDKSHIHMKYDLSYRL